MLGNADFDSGEPDHRFYVALQRFPHGETMRLSAVIAAVEDNVAH